MIAGVLAQASDAAAQGDSWTQAVAWARDNMVPLVITGSAVVIAVLVATVLARAVTRGISDEVRRHKTRRAMAYIAQFLALAIIGITWASVLNWQLWAGLVSVGLALALQNVILCFAGWVYLTLRRPYDIGDRIQVGALIGDVLDIRLFHTYVLEIGNWVDADQSTGRVVHLPNRVLFTQPISNYTQGFPYIWNELPIMITFESNWQRAKQILTDLVEQQARDISEEVRRFISRMKRDYPIRYAHLTPIIYTSIRDSGVLLTIRYLTNVRARRSTAAKLYEGILDAFNKEPNVTFAYPTYRMFRGTGLAPDVGGPPPDDDPTAPRPLALEPDEDGDDL